MSPSARYKYKGKNYSIIGLATISGKSENTLLFRLGNGWSVKEAVETPIYGCRQSRAALRKSTNTAERSGWDVEKTVKAPPHSSKPSKGQKGKLLDMLARLSPDELALVMATGLKCEHCPVAGEKGACYDKVVCCKTMSQWLGEE